MRHDRQGRMRPCGGAAHAPPRRSRMRDRNSTWWGPRRMTTIVDQMDVRPGGAWRFVMRESDGSEQGFRGTYREIAPPERIVQTFEWEGLPGHVIVEIVTFEDLGGGRTKVTTVLLFHTTEERDGMLSSGMESGLTESHERLAELLAEVA